MSRMIHFKRNKEATREENEQMMAMIVRELSGDWVHPIKCDEIQGQNRWFYDEIVYFGAQEDLAKGGPVDFFAKASMVDRFNFDEQRVGFFYVEDPECRRLRDLDPEKSFIVIYNGENSIPFILEIGKDEVDLARLIFEINTGIVKGTPRWGQRANTAVFTHYVNGLIYMIPEMMEPTEMQKDWRMMLMVRLVELIQEKRFSFFVPILSPFTQEPADRMLVPQLSSLIEAKKEELPNFFVLHPLTEQVVPYPRPLDDVKTFSPELILLWARRTILYLEVEQFELEIE